jgi:Glycosyltransferase family 87
MGTQVRELAQRSPGYAGRHVSWTTEHRPFLVALVLGAALRVVVQVAFGPALIHGDGPAYLNFLHTFVPMFERPVGYDLLLLYPLSLLTSKIVAVALVQHLIGLATAGLLYALLRHWGVSRWPATLATLPVLFDSLQLILEQMVLSDTLFVALVVLALAVLGWRRRPTAAVALVAGVLLGASATVRLVGEPLVLPGVAFCLLVGDGWRQRLAAAAALAVGFAAPVATYATWYHHDHGVYALAEFGGKSLYLRTTVFVDCATVSVPQYQRVLCPPQPVGQRTDARYYGWHDPATIPSLRPPPGTSRYRAMREFALAAIRAQPADYARVVLRDLMLNFDLWRRDRFEYDTAHKWQFRSWLHTPPAQPRRPLLDQLIRHDYAEYGGEQLTVRQPYASALVDYQRVGYLPGPLLLACLLLGLVGGLGIGPARRSGTRSICLLLTVTGTALLLVPAMTAEFVWRYQLPALALLPGGAALGYTALRRSGRVDSSAGDDIRRRSRGP